ncbi:MAG: DUF3883 domain-containing protein [Verrucomicrobiota bacterium]|jgi:hypothetical protein
MLEALEAIEHVGEVARLFLVLARWGKPRMEGRALVEACRRTAGLSSRYPRPKPAVAIAVSAGLLTYAHGTVTITSRGRTFSSQGAPGSLDLSQPQAKLLLGAFLDQAAIERGVASLVSNFQLVRGQLVARKNSIQPGNTQLLLCRLLQQLGAISSSGDYYIVIRAFEDLLGHLVIRTAKLTQAELLQMLERQRERGELAEQKVLEIEVDRLKELKRPDLAAKVERVSIHNVSAGYDINSFEKNDSPRYIEVKSSVGSQITFEWSAGERAVAARLGDAYCVFFVPFSFTLPDLAAPVAILRNPIGLIGSRCLVETPRSFLVREVPSPMRAGTGSRPAPTSSPMTYVYR